MPTSAYVVFGVLLLFGLAAFAFSWVATSPGMDADRDPRADRERELARTLEQAERAIRTARELLPNGR